MGSDFSGRDSSRDQKMSVFLRPITLKLFSGD